MKNLILVGAGGFAREVAWLVEEINQVNKVWNLLGFYDENGLSKKNLNGYPVFSKSDLSKFDDVYLTVCIGDPETRKTVVNRYNDDYKFATLIHPNVTISDTVTLGEGSIICKGNIITVNIEIGNHVIVNLDSTIGHDAILNDFVTILPSVNISGGVNVGECSSIGTGSQVIQYKNIGKNSIIGAGAVVVKDIEEYVVAVGSPAKVIKSRKGV